MCVLFFFYSVVLFRFIFGFSIFCKTNFFFPFQFNSIRLWNRLLFVQSIDVACVYRIHFSWLNIAFLSLTHPHSTRHLFHRSSTNHPPTTTNIRHWIFITQNDYIAHTLYPMITLGRQYCGEYGGKNKNHNHHKCVIIYCPILNMLSNSIENNTEEK